MTLNASKFEQEVLARLWAKLDEEQCYVRLRVVGHSNTILIEAVARETGRVHFTWDTQTSTANLAAPASDFLRHFVRLK